MWCLALSLLWVENIGALAGLCEGTVEIYEIGFNDQIEVGSRGFHIQTEILGKTELKIKTTVLEGGTTKHVAARLWSSAIGVEELQDLAETQHKLIIDKVLRNDID